MYLKNPTLNIEQNDSFDNKPNRREMMCGEKVAKEILESRYYDPKKDEAFKENLVEGYAKTRNLFTVNQLIISTA